MIAAEMDSCERELLHSICHKIVFSNTFSRSSGDHSKRIVGKMHSFLFISLLCLQFFYTKISSREHNARVKRQTDVSYGSPAYKYCECGRPNTVKRRNFRVIGGQGVINEFPWMVAIITISNLRLRCGGAIINDQYVVTAAHCRHRKVETKVVVGEYNLCKLHSNCVIFSVDKLIIHPDYKEETDSADIMLVKLVMRITFNMNIRPICLPRIGPNVATEFGGRSVTVLGWGLSDISNETCGLRAANLTLYKPIDCPINISTLFCAGFTKVPRGTCKGDSGGPLQLLNKNGRYELIGIASRGIGCGDVTYPEFFTNIPRMIPWIMKITTRDSMFCWR